MSVANHSAAAEEIADLFRIAAAAQGWPVEWPNLAFSKPAETATWARWTLTGGSGGQRALAGPTGRSRFGKSGAVVVELFTPLGKGVTLGYAAAQIAIDAYEGERTPSDVWFRNVRISDDGQGRGGDAAWWSTVVIADFTYDNSN